MRHETARAVTRHADQISQAVQQSVQLLDRLGVDTSAPLHSAIRQAKRGIFARTGPGKTPDQEQVMGAQYLVESVYSRRLWKKTSNTIFTPHPRFAQELSYARTGPIHWNLFNRLSHPDPLIVFAEPVPLPDGGGSIVGVQVYGSSGSPRQIVSTQGSGEGDGLNLAVFVESSSGKLTLTTFGLPRSGKSTLAETFSMIPELALMRRDKAFYQVLAGYVVHTVMYLCCSERDESYQGSVRDRSAVPVVAGASKPSTERESRVVGLGYRLASDLDLSAPEEGTSRRSGRPVSGSSGRRHVAHRRRWHLRFQRHGRGLESIKLIEIDSYRTKGPEPEEVPIRQFGDA